MSDDDTEQIKDWRSIITLVVFVLTNIVVLFPFHVPIPVPAICWNACWASLSRLRVISDKQCRTRCRPSHDDGDGKIASWVSIKIPLNFITAPLVADLFLLAILAIGRQEVYDGTVGADNISPIDIMVFFITLAYIAISIDASGLIRYLAFKVLEKGGEHGRKLFFYLYAFFFGIGTFIGNDPIILSGTAFLAYMTRVSSNIKHPRAWIHTQFAVANTASAILVSSNPTNLVLAGAFNIKFIVYTANMIVPVVATAVVLFPFLLFIVFADNSLIPATIEMHQLDDERKGRTPVNPNIPNARGQEQEREIMEMTNTEQGQQLSLEEIMNPFVDRGGAAFGGLVMAATLITVLALNAASQSSHERPVFWVTLPAAFVMFCWDVAFGWINREETREIARTGRRGVEEARQKREDKRKEEEEARATGPVTDAHSPEGILTDAYPSGDVPTNTTDHVADDEKGHGQFVPGDEIKEVDQPASRKSSEGLAATSYKSEADREKDQDSNSEDPCLRGLSVPKREQATLLSLIAQAHRWSQETFPTVTAVVAHLPFALIPFAFSMFVLVQALVTKGWVSVFAHGWDHWVNKTSTVGAIGGMGFLSVILCNFAGTNIGTTILLCRVIQAWQDIHDINGVAISDRTFWATVYSMALGVNFGAFSAAFSASLAGLLWRDILARKYIRVRALEFARVNLPIIAIAMTVGCAVLVGEVYVVRNDLPYSL